MAALEKSNQARADLVAHYVYLYEEAGVSVADRFLDNAETSFALLVEHPQIGAPLTLRAPELAGMRKWKVDGFPNHLIFYMPEPSSVVIVRVLHGAQDWWQILGLLE